MIHSLCIWIALSLSLSDALAHTGLVMGLLAPLGMWALESEKKPWLCVKCRHVTETGSGTGLSVHWVKENFEAFLETSIQSLSLLILIVNLMGSSTTLEIRCQGEIF